MWARLNNDNEIAQLYTRPTAVTLDEVQYPASIFSIWTASELQSLNIWSVSMTNSPEDPEWYDVSLPIYTVLKESDGDPIGVNGTYTNTPKPIEDVYKIPLANTAGVTPGNKVGSNTTTDSSAKVGNVISLDASALYVEITKGIWTNGQTLRIFESDGTTTVGGIRTVNDDLILHSRSKKWNMIQVVKDLQGSLLQPYDWYYIRKYDTGVAIPAEVQSYRDGVRSHANSLESNISSTTSMANLQEKDISSGWPAEPTI